MIDVVMPQMGESIVEGTLTKWLKKAGDRVERDEPLFEISTDKVDTEIPSPAAGIAAIARATAGLAGPAQTPRLKNIEMSSQPGFWSTFAKHLSPAKLPSGPALRAADWHSDQFR